MVALTGNHFILCTSGGMLLNHIQLGTYYHLAIPSAITTDSTRIGRLLDTGTPVFPTCELYNIFNQ